MPCYAALGRNTVSSHRQLKSTLSTARAHPPFPPSAPAPPCPRAATAAAQHLQCTLRHTRMAERRLWVYVAGFMLHVACGCNLACSTPQLCWLSGAFMICIKLRAKIPCRQTLFEVLAEAGLQRTT